MGLWELMASGGLPALAKLRVRLDGRHEYVEEVRTRVAPALEAASCGGSGTSPLTCPVMGGPTTPWPRAWPPVAGGAGTALSPCYLMWAPPQCRPAGEPPPPPPA
jgi:hypothetical protein